MKKSLVFMFVFSLFAVFLNNTANANVYFAKDNKLSDAWYISKNADNTEWYIKQIDGDNTIVKLDCSQINKMVSDDTNLYPKTIVRETFNDGRPSIGNLKGCYLGSYNLMFDSYIGTVSGKKTLFMNFLDNSGKKTSNIYYITTDKTAKYKATFEPKKGIAGNLSETSTTKTYIDDWIKTTPCKNMKIVGATSDIKYYFRNETKDITKAIPYTDATYRAEVNVNIANIKNSNSKPSISVSDFNDFKKYEDIFLYIPDLFGKGSLGASLKKSGNEYKAIFNFYFKDKFCVNIDKQAPVFASFKNYRERIRIITNSTDKCLEKGK